MNDQTREKIVSLFQSMLEEKDQRNQDDGIYRQLFVMGDNNIVINGDSVTPRPEEKPAEKE